MCKITNFFIRRKVGDIFGVKKPPSFHRKAAIIFLFLTEELFIQISLFDYVNQWHTEDIHNREFSRRDLCRAQQKAGDVEGTRNEEGFDFPADDKSVEYRGHGGA